MIRVPPAPLVSPLAWAGLQVRRRRGEAEEALQVADVGGGELQPLYLGGPPAAPGAGHAGAQLLEGAVHGPQADLLPVAGRAPVPLPPLTVLVAVSSRPAQLPRWR